MQLPESFLNAILNTQGFNRITFEAVHQEPKPITSVRINPSKFKIENIDERQQQTNSSSLSSLTFSSKITWCPYGYYLTERPSFTLDPLLHAGAYYVQEASSMFLWKVLEQTIGIDTTNKNVLDLCAAPGGKSTLLATYFKDGLVVSNEVIKSRASILTENSIKWGSGNMVVTNNDPADFKSLKSFFDVIVIDAPCSGSGLFRKDETAVHEWSEQAVQLCSARQQRIVADVFDSLKEDGILIYSTCSYSTEENESVADWMIDTFQVTSCKLQINDDWKIVESISSKHQSYGYRFWPDKTKGEGFFITAFKKQSTNQYVHWPSKSLAKASKQELSILNNFIPLDSMNEIFKQGEVFRIIPKIFKEHIEVLANHLYIKKAGIALGTIKGTDVIPSHELALSNFSKINFQLIEVTKDIALEYLRKQEIKLTASKGWALITYCGLSLGWVKVLPNRINNYYPSEWRILKQ